MYARSYGQGPAWIKGTTVDTAGPHNFTVRVNLAGQFTSWRRHIDQLKRCFEDITVQNEINLHYCFLREGGGGEK